jgi:hypothetical protein
MTKQLLNAPEGSWKHFEQHQKGIGKSLGISGQHITDKGDTSGMPR